MGVFNKKDEISREVAIQEFDNWCNGWSIGRKLKNLKGETLEIAEQQKETIINLIMDGNLTYDSGKNVLNYTLVDSIPEFENGLTLYRPGGQEMIEFDKLKEGDDIKRAYTSVMIMAKEAKVRVFKLEYNTDILLLSAVITYFLLA